MLIDPYLPAATEGHTLSLVERIYPSRTLFEAHAHAQGQFACALSGAMTVFTEHGNWLVPIGCAVWMPPRVEHSMAMSGEVTMLNVFVAAACETSTALGLQCKVVEVSPLLRQLLQAAKSLPAATPPERNGYVWALLSCELPRMPAMPLSAPLPSHPRLQNICRDLLAAPSAHADIETMAAKAGMSRRTFTRHFRQQTGLGFTDWRQQACLLWAMARLSEGMNITQVALDLGYNGPSAFSSAFKRVLGDSPGAYCRGLEK